MPSNATQSRIDRNSYVPPHIQQAMTQHMQQNMPAHLKKYVGENAAYVPKHMEAQIAQQMQKNMPSHLKQYAGAYMQQQVMQPNTTRLHGPNAGPRQTVTPPPTPDKLNRSHSIEGLGQHTVELDTLPNSTPLFQAEQNQQSPEGTQQVQPQSPEHVSPEQAFEFIINPEEPSKNSKLSMGDSLPKKIAFIGGGLLILLIIFVIGKNIFSSGGVSDSFVAIAQQQQQILVLTKDALDQQTLTTANKNFTATADTSISTSQAELFNYLGLNGKKVSPKEIQLGLDPSLPKELEAAAAATTYNETYKTIMKAELNKYSNLLKSTYQETTGQKGRALLSNDFDDAQLLLIQLEDTKS